MFPHAVISTGMLPHQFCAFLEGAFGSLDSEFERTPKFASVTGAVGQPRAAGKRERVKVKWAYVLVELFFIAYQISWAVFFAGIGLFWCTALAAFTAACVVYVAFFYGDHLGKVCFVIDTGRIKVLSRRTNPTSPRKPGWGR